MAHPSAIPLAASATTLLVELPPQVESLLAASVFPSPHSWRQEPLLCDRERERLNKVKEREHNCTTWKDTASALAF